MNINNIPASLRGKKERKKKEKNVRRAIDFSSKMPFLDLSLGSKPTFAMAERSSKPQKGPHFSKPPVLGRGVLRDYPQVNYSLIHFS